MKRLLPLLTLASVLSTQAAPLSATTRASNDFGLDVFLKLQKEKSEQNVFFSPISVSQAMTLLLAGADGSTYAELSKGMKLGQVKTLSSVISSTAEDMKKLTANSDPAQGLVVEIANSVWGDQNFKFNAAYLKTVKGELKAEARSIDFKAQGAATPVNARASEKTHGKIPTVTDDRTLAGMKAMLMNASYFKGDWTRPFENTRPAGFKGLKSTIEVNMMSNGYEGDMMKMYAGQDVEAIELTYGKWQKGGQPASMIVIKPADYAAFAKKLSSTSLQKIVEATQAAQTDSVAVQLPKFSFSQEFNLIPAIKSLGINEIFTSKANFSKMSDMGLEVGLIKQNTFVAVDEKGTEAAAVTSIGVRATSMPRPAAKKFVADSPFVVVIKSNVTGAILFVGGIVDPSAK